MARGRNNDEEEDHFSKLPEALIIYILSLLNMEDCFKTRLLSNSWKNRWTNVDSISYESEHERNYEKYFMQTKEFRRIIDDQWISFIDHTLMRCNNGKIMSFSLLSDTHFPAALLNKWIEHVLDKNVETLRLSIRGQLPDCLFRSSSVTNLELFFGEGNTSATVNFSKLKSLLLDYAYVDDAFMDRILVGSPLLESIVIREQFWITRLNLMSPRMKTLELLHIFGSYTIEIRAPWLQELKISGQLAFTKFELVDVSSLSKATLIFTSIDHAIDEEYDITVQQYNHNWIPMVTKLLISLSYVPELIIGSHPIQVLSWLKVKRGVTPSSRFMCKHLTIETYLWKFDIPGIICLIENAPHLETLIIKVLPFSDDREEAFSFYKTKNLFQDGDPHLNMPYGKFQKLKNVKIEYSEMSCADNIKDHDGGFFDFELIEYILKGAVVLEKLVLCSSRVQSCGDSKCLMTNCFHQYVSTLWEKIDNHYYGYNWE